MPTSLMAIRYARKGYYVFPLRDRGKAPRKGLKWRQESSNNVDKIVEWAKKYPLCNWGLDCGKSNLVVIDEDNKNGKQGAASLLDLEIEHGTLPDNTIIVKTANSGKHYYYEGLTGSPVGKLGDGIDVRSLGGFVVIPGSIVDDPKTGLVGGTYDLLSDSPPPKIPEWLKGLIGEPKTRSAGNDQKPLVELDQDLNTRIAVDYLKLHAPIAIENQGGNHTTFTVIARVKDFGVSETAAFDLLVDHWNERCEPRWEADELIKIIRNVYNYSQNDPGSAAPQLDFPDIDPVLIPEKIANFESASGDLGSLIIPYSKFSHLEFPAKECYLDPWVQSQTISLIYADAGVGKSWLAMSVLQAIAEKRDLGPWKFKKAAPVLYCDAEMTGSDVQKRLKGLGIKESSIFHVYSDAYASSMGFPKSNIMNEKWRKAMKDALLSLGIKVVVFDNLSSLMPTGDENTKEEWNPINQWFLDLRYNDITIIVLHHTNKSGGQRGSGAKVDNIDFLIKLKRPPNYKINDGARFEIIFEKNRLDNDELFKVSDISMHLTRGLDGQYKWDFGKPGANRRMEVLRMKSEGCSNKQIAEEVDCAKGNISYHLKQLKEEGHLDAKGGVTASGLDLLAKYIARV